MGKQRSARGSAGRQKLPDSSIASGGESGRDEDENPSTDRDITTYTQVARKKVGESWPEIVTALVMKARNGRYHETKLLLDLCDLSNIDENEVKYEKQRQLCDALLEGLGLVPPEEAVEPDGKSGGEKNSSSHAAPAKGNRA